MASPDAGNAMESDQAMMMLKISDASGGSILTRKKQGQFYDW